MKKCPICELNYIDDNQFVCKICYRNQPARTYANNELQLLKQREERNKKMKILEYKSFLLEILYSYGFEGFLHTANLSNFISIFNSGFLYSRDELIKQNIPFEDNAMQEIIDSTSYFIKEKTRFYYRPITPTNVSAYKYYKQKHPVIMVFNPDLIFDDDTCFCNGCARAIDTDITKDPQTAIQFNWDSIFDTTPLSQIQDNDNNANYPIHDRNAEFLYPNKVSTDKIIKIYFKTKSDMDYAISQLGNDSRFVLDCSKFYGD